MPTLFEKSGAEGEYRRFKFEILKLAARNALPGYDLILEAPASGAEPTIRMRRNDAKNDDELPTRIAAVPSALTQGKVSSRKLPDLNKQPKALEPTKGQGGQQLFDASAVIRRSVADLSDAATKGFMTDETITQLRSECPGWDLYALHADFEGWVSASAERTPANWQRAFIGWVRKHHEKNKHELRG
jgi:hypothetical protein